MSRADLEESGSLLPARVSGAVRIERLLREDSGQVEEHRRLLEVDAALLGLLAVPEGIVPHKVYVHLATFPADGEACLHQAQSPEVPALQALSALLIDESLKWSSTLTGLSSWKKGRRVSTGHKFI